MDSVVPLKPNGEGAESLPIMPTDTLTSSPTQIGNTELKWKKLLKQSTGANRLEENNQAKAYLEDADLEGFSTGENQITPR